MRRLLIPALLLLAMPLSAFSAAEYYRIDPTHTYPHFAIDHLGFSTLYGRFDQTTGKLVIDQENGNGSIDIHIASVSITTGYSKRDEHLRSPDFLNVMEYPDITFQSRNVRFNGKEQAVVEGDLTLLGVERPVKLQVTRIRCGKNPMTRKDTCGFDAHTEIKRSDFGSKYGIPGIGDNMKLWFQVEAVKE